MALLTSLAYIALAVITLAYLYIRRRFSYFKDHGIPYIEPSLPMGSFKGIGTKVHLCDILRNSYEKFKGQGMVVGLFNMLQPTYLVLDAELMKLITIKDFNHFVNRGTFVNEEDEPLTGHLFSIEDERWRFLRNKLSPTFTSGKIKGMYSTIDDKGKNFVAAVEKAASGGRPVAIKDLANRFTVDIVSSVAFGMEANTLNFEHPGLIKIFTEIFGNDGISPAYFFLLAAFPKLAKFLKLRQFSKHLSDFFMNVVSSNIKNREENDDKRSDFLNMLIQLKNKGSIDGDFSTATRKLTHNEVLAQAFVFFIAGSDTSSTAMSFALTELAHHPEIQERLRAEIQEKTKDDNGVITYENLHEMTYLNQVINETLRMYTPVFLTIRTTSKDYPIPNTNHTIPKGMPVMIPTTAFHYDSRFWNDPEKFDPERFTPEEIAKRPASVYVPFGDGPRNCIGMRFGLVNVKFGVATIVQNLRVGLDSRVTFPIKMNPRNSTLEPKDGFWLNFEKI